MLPLLIALSLSADAQPKPKLLGPPVVAVFAKNDDQVAERASGKLEVDLREALKKRGVQVPDYNKLFPQQPESSEEGDKLVAAGKEAYDNLDLDGAVTSLTDAALFFVKHPTLTDPKKLAEVFLFLGSAELQNGSKQPASKDFWRAAVLDPDLRPDAKLFGNDVQKAFVLAKTELIKQHGVLLIDSVPTGSTVELDGKRLGTTPQPAVELAPGRHHVRAIRPGYATAAVFPEVKNGEDQDVKLTLTPLPSFATWADLAGKLIARSSFDSQKLPAAAASLASGVGARYLVLINVTTARGISSDAEAQVWDTDTGDRLRELRLNVDPAEVEKTAEAIKRWIDRPAPVEVVEAQPSAGPEMLHKPWVWAIAGAVVIGAAAATGAGIASAHHGHPWDFATNIP